MTKVIFNPRVKSDYFDIVEDTELNLEIGEIYYAKAHKIAKHVELFEDNGKIVGVYPIDWFETC